jgi:carboxylesterase
MSSLEAPARAAAARPDRPVGADGIVIGAGPLELHGTSDRGMLLLHGFNDTPQSVAHLARALHALGWTVSVPLLPHHGRGAEEMERHGNANEWIAFARSEWKSFQWRVPRAVLCGQSMGGALAVILATEAPPEALVLLAPYLAMGRLARTLATVWPLWQLVTPQLFSEPQQSLRDPLARSQTLGNGCFTPRLVSELKKVVSLAQRMLPQVRVPALVLHARSDYRIPSPSAQRAFEKLGSTDKSLIWRDGSGHVLAADVGREEVSMLVAKWLDDRVSRLQDSQEA